MQEWTKLLTIVSTFFFVCYLSIYIDFNIVISLLIYLLKNGSLLLNIPLRVLFIEVLYRLGY